MTQESHPYLDSHQKCTYRGFPGGISGKESVCQHRGYKRHRFNLWVWKIPWSRKWQPTLEFLPGDWWATVHRAIKSWTRLSD